jgi:hypothetical protein
MYEANQPRRGGRPNLSPRRGSAFFTAAAAAVCAALLSAGCGSPNVPSIAVRKENQSLRDQLATLQRARDADAATIKSLESHATTVPSLPNAQLENLFTTHGLALGRLTGGADLDRDKPGDEGLKVQATPTDDNGEPFKAAGSFTVEAFDLANPDAPAVGRWTFDTKAARDAWVGSVLVRAYMLTCPWQQQGPPKHPDITVKVTFRDQLTAREFTQQKLIKVQLPPTTQTASGSR